MVWEQCKHMLHLEAVLRTERAAANLLSSPCMRSFWAAVTLMNRHRGGTPSGTFSRLGVGRPTYSLTPRSVR